MQALSFHLYEIQILTLDSPWCFLRVPSREIRIFLTGE